MQQARDRLTYSGACHCNGVKFHITIHYPELSTCDYCICRKKNALIVKVYENDVEVLAGDNCLTEYQLYTHTIRHFLCKVCGIYTSLRKPMAHGRSGRDTGTRYLWRKQAMTLRYIS